MYISHTYSDNSDVQLERYTNFDSFGCFVSSRCKLHVTFFLCLVFAILEDKYLRGKRNVTLKQSYFVLTTFY